MLKIYTNGQSSTIITSGVAQACTIFHKFGQCFFYYDRILIKEGIDLETYKYRDKSTLLMNLLMNVFQKDVIVIVYFFISKTILTIKKEFVVDVTNFY